MFPPSLSRRGRTTPANRARREIYAFINANFEGAPAVGHQETPCQGQVADRREDVGTLVDCWDTPVTRRCREGEGLLEDAVKSWTLVSVGIVYPAYAGYDAEPGLMPQRHSF